MLLKTIDREELQKVLQKEDYSSEKLVSFFKKYFKTEYDSDAGVWEGYSVGEHTAMVLKQFDKYFADSPLPAKVTPTFFRIILALHDIGKPKAIGQGDKKRQHDFTKPIIASVLNAPDFKSDDVNIALGLVSADPLGEFIKHGKLDENGREIKEGAKLAGVTTDEFFELLSIFYKVDAGSYTEDAGGLKSLDHLFIFSPEKGTMEFSPEIERKVKKLKERVNQKT